MANMEIKDVKNWKWAIVVILVAMGVYYRLLDHPFNFTPLGAIALFSGFFLRKKWSIVIPLIALFLGDFFIGFYSFYIMISVYMCFALNAFLGTLISEKSKLFFILGTSALGSIVFFIITNFSVWFFGDWYPKTTEGILSCYAMAIPFFRNSLLGDVFFTGIIFGSFELAFFYGQNFLKKDKLKIKEV